MKGRYRISYWQYKPLNEVQPLVKLVNLTPHDIVLRDRKGNDTVIKASGIIARVDSVPGIASMIPGIPVPVLSPMAWGAVYGLPSPQPNVLYLVSAIVADRVKRSDLVCPGTGPKDQPIRSQDGKLMAVTRLVRREGL